jgi:uncharacterized protein (TIGR03437 family)
MKTYHSRFLSAILTIASALASGIATAQTISTIAGDGAASFAGDAGLATAAALNHPRIMAIDAAGNIFVADMDNSRVRRVATNGIITTVAGTGVAGYSGDNGPAIAAQLSQPQAVAIDASGNLIIADTQNRRIRRVDASGTITTIAGTGVEGYTGDGGPATSAQLHQAVDLAVDSTGNIYFADSTGQRIRKIWTNGIISTVAGNGVQGFSGDGGSATSAMMDFPVAVALDAQNNIYISDANNFRIRMVNAASGNIATIVGNGVEGFSGDGGPATSATLNFAYGVRVDSTGRIFVADASNNRVRMVANGTISTVAGTGADGFSGDGGLATGAMLSFPWAVAVDASGNVLVSDRVNTRVRKIAMSTQAAPVLFANGTVNVASYAPAGSANGAVAPGSMVAIFGTDLAGGTGRAVIVPLQTTVLDTTVTMNGIPVPLFYVSKTQINAQVPFETALGSVSVQVMRGTQTTSTQTVQVTSVAPGVFTLNQQGTGPGAFLHANFQGVSDTNPAQGGETVLMYCTGLGATNPFVASGTAAVVTTNTLVTPTVTIGGLPAAVSFSGLAPTFVGLYQMNVQVPAGLPTGPQNVVVRMNGVTANTTTLSAR